MNEQEEAMRKDAARYRWLRSQHWNESLLCVVANPKAAVRLGHDCPSLGRLDEAIDGAMKQNAGPEQESEWSGDAIRRKSDGELCSQWLACEHYLNDPYPENPDRRRLAIERQLEIEREQNRRESAVFE